MTRWLAAIVMLAVSGTADAQRQVQSPPDPYVHAGTGFAFPASLAGFTRGAIVEYDADATDVGASYHLIENGRSVATVTVYVFPLSPDGGPGVEQRCLHSFEGARQALVDRFPGASGVADDRRPAPDTDALVAGHHASYRFSGGFFEAGGTVLSQLYIYCPAGGEWQVKYRTSAPADSDREGAIETMMRALPWPAALGG